MDESDHAFGAPPWSLVDELHTVTLQTRESTGQVIDDVTDVVERRFGVLGDELRDARLGIGRLDELDPLLPVAEEDDAHVLIREVDDPFGAQAEGVAEEGKRSFDSMNRDLDMVQRAELHRRGGT